MNQDKNEKIGLLKIYAILLLLLLTMFFGVDFINYIINI